MLDEADFSQPPRCTILTRVPIIREAYAGVDKYKSTLLSNQCVETVRTRGNMLYVRVYVYGREERVCVEDRERMRASEYWTWQCRRGVLSRGRVHSGPDVR